MDGITNLWAFVAAGALLNLTPGPDTFFILGRSTAQGRRAGMLSAEGRCKTLDAAADGYARGEGCRAVLLSGVLDGTPVSCLVHGSCVNQDGRSSSLTAPNGPAQQAVIRTALQSRGCGDASRVHVLEMHGTGTAQLEWVDEA